jgi:hypothetical protein
MGSSDITTILLTANKLPLKWVEFHKEHLLAAVGDSPLITISRQPLDWGTNLLDTEPEGISNIYWQMLRGAEIAKTDYIGIAEDDTLYPPEHFHGFRPPHDAFAYNINRFNVFTWGRPVYFWKKRYSNSTLIAPRQLMIEALEERFTKYPEGTPSGYTGELGRANIEDKLGLQRRKVVEFETEESIVRVDHDFGTDRLARSHRKGYGPLKALEIPRWGRAKDLVQYFK